MTRMISVGGDDKNITFNHEGGGGGEKSDTVAAKVRGWGGGGDCRRVAGGVQWNDPSLAAAKEEETKATVRSDGVGAATGTGWRDDAITAKFKDGGGTDNLNCRRRQQRQPAKQQRRHQRHSNGVGRKKTLPFHGIPMVGIVRKVQLTPTQLPQTSPPWW